MSNSILITGISGFVGGHFTKYLYTSKRNCSIHGVSRTPPAWDFIEDCGDVFKNLNFYQCDLLNKEKIDKIIHEVSPDYILHLASFSSVSESWQNPMAAFLNNTNAFLNIVESVRNQDLKCKIISVGSSEEYGIVKGNIPISESHSISPANPYAVARVSEEYLACIYTKGFNLNICNTRSFNHIGPGQKDHFVVSSIAKQFAEISLKKTKPTVKIGDGSIVRDFIDIEDVTSAYDSIFLKGKIGETYNVCRGEGNSILQIVNLFSQLTDIPVTIQQDKKLIRPIDNPVLIGNYEKIKKHTGWSPKISIEDSLMKIFEYWQDSIRKRYEKKK